MEMTRDEILAVAKPILFSTPMVQAIMNGRKSVTRRDPFQMPDSYNNLKGLYRDDKGRLCAVFQCSEDITTEAVYFRFQPGDLMWVRETWNADWCDNVIYKADGGSAKAAGYTTEPKWRPSIYMPKKAARLFLRVTDVRVERLRPMGFDEFEAEGLPIISGLWDTTARYANLWDSTIKPADLPLYGWEANPWVWVIDFEHLEAQ